MIEFYPNTINYPREAVEAKFEKGELKSTENRLLEFAERHRKRVWVISSEDSVNPDDELLLDNLRAYLLIRGSLHPAAEMGELIKEINKEVWYRNETQKEQPEEVAVDWEERYAAQWREARMFEAFVLIEKMRSQLIAILRATNQ